MLKASNKSLLAYKNPTSFMRIMCTIPCIIYEVLSTMRTEMIGMESHHSRKRLAPCGLEDIDLAISVFATKSDVIAPIKMYLNGITASTNATPIITHITLSVCCNICTTIIKRMHKLATQLST